MQTKKSLQPGPLAATFLLILGMSTSAWPASYKVLHSFKGGNSVPTSGLITDAAGNGYGSTWPGVEVGGTIYELSAKAGYQSLYYFSLNGSTGFGPQGNLVFDSAGNLYGTTIYGGRSGSNCGSLGSCGVVFELSPPSNGVGLWTETVLYSFCSQGNCSDGANPQSGVIFDSAGNLYGTTSGGGDRGFGTVFELSPSSGGWTETVLYNFCSQTLCVDGEWPYGGLVSDAAGNLYGTTTAGGVAAGTVFELVPTGRGWTETTLYSFCSLASCADGGAPYAGVTFDATGNLYGTASGGGNLTCGGRGTVFELKPRVGGGWTETTLHTFGGRDGAAPYAGVVLDPAGNVYGTTYQGGEKGSGCGPFGCGTVFRLTPTVGGQWTETLFRFPSEAFGVGPMAPVTLDSAGSVYGTTTSGGQGNGVTFRITQ
jgi:uncharacterized repeat protein (TIGR03803 family)